MAENLIIDIEDGTIDGYAYAGEDPIEIFYKNELPLDVEDSEGNVVHRYALETVDVVLVREDSKVHLDRVNNDDLHVKLVNWDQLKVDLEAARRDGGFVSPHELRQIINHRLGTTSPWEGDIAREWWDRVDRLTQMADDRAHGYLSFVEPLLSRSDFIALKDARENALAGPDDASLATRPSLSDSPADTPTPGQAGQGIQR